MKKPYVILNVYWATAPADGIPEGKLSGRLSKDPGIRKIQTDRRIKAWKVIDRYLLRKRIRFSQLSFIQSLEDADALRRYVIDTISGSEFSRELGGSSHGELSFHTDLHIPGFTMKNRKDLVEILLECPYQPQIPGTAYALAELEEKQVDESKERKKLWRKALKFVK